MSYNYYTDSGNQFFDVDIFFDAQINWLKIICTFLNSVTVMQTNNHEKICTAEFGHGKEGRCYSNSGNLSRTLSSKNSRNTSVSYITVEVPILLMKDDILCFAVTASDGRYTAEVKRMLTINSGMQE